MTDNYFKRFVEWQNYVHYILLTIGLFIWHALVMTSKLEQNYMNTLLGFDKWVAFGEMFLWYLLGLFVVDSIVHLIFWMLPEPMRWRD
jgi:hypothetical protein